MLSYEFSLNKRDSNFMDKLKYVSLDKQPVYDQINIFIFRLMTCCQML